MKYKKHIILFFLMLSQIQAAEANPEQGNYGQNYSQQELNREERRKYEEELRKLEKTKSEPEVQLNQLYENIQPIGDQIKKIEVHGNTVLRVSKIEGVAQKYIGKIGGKNILNLMKELENLYLQNGYIGARVKMDMQKVDMSNGKIVLKVLEGHIEDIRFKDSDKNKLSIFASFPTSKGDIININKLDQGIDNLNSVSSNNAKLDILAGETLGGSIIEITNQKSKKISGALNYNNLGQKSTGEERIKASLFVNDILGLNDSFTGTYQRKLGSHKYKESKNFSFYYKIPVKYWEYSISRDQSEYASTIKSFAKTYQSTGISRNMNYSLKRIINRNSESKTSIGATLTNKETTNYFDNIKLITSSRKLSVLKLDVTHNRRLLGGMLNANVTYHEGLKRFGAERDDDKDKYTPKAQFKKYTGDISWYKPFSIKEQRFSYRTALSAQYSDHILYSSEKLAIGDDTTVRGFKENSIMGDKGAYLRNEFGYNYKYFEPFIAYDYGRVKDVYKDERYERHGKEISGASIGLRTYFKHMDMSITYSKAITAPSYIKKNTHELYFTITAKF